jgi:hypothetical protein
MLGIDVVAAVVGLVVFGFNSTAQCQAMGKHDFDTLCAPCHGTTGTGEGRDLTEANPPDITQLSRRNAGQFPFDDAYRNVDGRDMKGSHKRFEMPFWGEYLQKQDQKNTPVSNAMTQNPKSEPAIS